MITYEEAEKTALSHRPEMNRAIEYEHAYVFYRAGARGADRYDNDIVVWKDG